MAKARGRHDTELQSRDDALLPADDPFERRVLQLRKHSGDESEDAPNERSIERARGLLKHIRQLTRGGRVVEHLANPFLTVIGGGLLQMEWKQGERYLEVEIPPKGPFAVWHEGPSGEGESHPRDIEEMSRFLVSFWQS